MDKGGPYVESLKSKGCDPEFKCKLEKNFVTDDADTLMDSCLLQFPHGVGGFDEQRLRSDGTHSKNLCCLEDCLAHSWHLTKHYQGARSRHYKITR